MSNDELPNGWTEIGFSELNSFSSSTINPADYPSEIFELYSVPIFPTRKPEILKGADIGSTKQAVAADDVLICKINPRINRVWKVMPKTTRRQIASSEWIAMRAPGTNPDYLRAYFSSHEFREILCEDLTGVGGSLTRAQPKRVAKFKIPLAPLAEQKRIADKLEAVLARVDSCRARLDRVPALLKRFRQSVLAAATSGKLTAEWRKTNGINDEWENTDLLSICSSISDGDHLPPPQTTTGIPFLTIGNISSGRLNFTNARYVPESYFENIRATRVPKPGDTLYSVVGASIGIPVMVEVDRKFCFQRHIAILKPSEGTSPGFLHLLMSSPEVFREAWSLTTGTAQPTLPLGTLRSIPVSVPTLPEQKEIVRRVEDLFAFADRIEARLATAQKTVERLTPATLAKAFRGELVPQAPNDEPASVLLKRVQTDQAALPPRNSPMKKLRKTRVPRFEP